MNHRLVARMIGFLLLAFSASMLTMVPFTLWYGEYMVLLAVFESVLIGAAFSGGLIFWGRKESGMPFRREALSIVGLGWILSAALGALPFLIGGMVTNYTDAYFEAMSGLTTTGASILRSIEDQSKALIFWRSFLHFMGGLGIVVIFVAVLPVLGVGGKALYKQEVPGPVPEGLTPRIKDTALGLFRVYLALNVIEMALLKFGGMSYYDAINHALATMATGGFSTKNASIASFYSPMIEWIITIFMFLAGANFMLHMRFSKGDFLCYLRDTEFRAYCLIILCSAIFMSFVLYFTDTQAVSHPGRINIRDTLFNTVSIMTTTGFGTVDFDQWPPVCKAVLLLLMFVGGMAGSTAGGLKVIRAVILFRSAQYQLQTEATPRVVRVLKLGNKVVDRRVFGDAFALFFLWILVFSGATVLVAFLSPGQSFLTSISATAACLNNIGPGFEMVGPTGNYAGMQWMAKWVLSILMLMGRLELYVILIIFTPGFWLGR